MQLICSACGFNFFVAEDQPGDLVQCPTCGKRLRRGMDSAVEVSTTADLFEVLAPPAGDDIDFAFPPASKVVEAPPTSVVPPPIPRVQKNNRKLIASLIITVAICMLTILGILGQREIFPNEPVTTDWDRAHRKEVIDLKSAAENFAFQGKLKESYDKYQQLLSLVGDQDVKDPLMVQLIASARSGQDRVFGLMVSTTPPPQTPPVIVRNWSTVDHHLPPVVVDSPLQIPPALVSPLPARVETPSSAPVAVRAVQLTPAEIAADTAPAIAGGDHKPHADDFTLPESVTDKQIGDAIDKGVVFLASHFVDGQIDVKLPGTIPKNLMPRPPGRPDDTNMPPDLQDNGRLGPPLPPMQGMPPNRQVGRNLQQLAGAYSTPGIDALCVYALLHAGQAMDVPGIRANDPATIQMLEVLKTYKMAYTYHRSLRAAALAVFNRTQDSNALEEDVRWLQQASTQGGYTYTMPDRRDSDPGWDNSNSQYGLLGVWAGSDSGKAVSRDYWLAVQNHWTNCTVGDGTWPYSGGTQSSGTMTCAGIASLLVSAIGWIAGRSLRRWPQNSPRMLISMPGWIGWMRGTIAWLAFITRELVLRATACTGWTRGACQWVQIFWAARLVFGVG